MTTDSEDSDDYIPQKKKTIKQEKTKKNKTKQEESQEDQKRKLPNKQIKNNKKQNNSKKNDNIQDKEQQKILDYMKMQNRPYSVINVTDNLHQKIKKNIVQIILDELVEIKQLVRYEVGVSKIYMYNQDLYDEVEPFQLKSLQDIVAENKSQLDEEQEHIKNLTSQLKQINQQLTDKELYEKIQETKKIINIQEDKLVFYKSDKYLKIPDEDIIALEKEQLNFEKEHKKRKTIFKNVINQLEEGMQKTKTQIYELFNIEPVE